MKATCPLFVGWCLLTFCSSPQSHASDPLDQWDVAARPPAAVFRGLAYKDQTFVGVGPGTDIVVSTNGMDWSIVSINLPNFAGALAVTDGDGQFVAVGPFGNILTSRNGLEWTRRRVAPQPPHEEFWAVTWGRAGFVAVGFQWDPLPITIVAISTNGVEWEKFTLPTATTPRNIAYGDGVYVAAAPEGSMYSTNARDWTFLSGVRGEAIAYGGGQFVIALGSSGYVSSNGLDWTEITLPVLVEGSENRYFTAHYANGTFVLAGFCGACPNSNRPSLVATSTNGRQWTLRPFGTNVVWAIRDIVFVDGRFYVGDEQSRIWRSGRIAPVSQPAITHVSWASGQTTLSFTTVPGFHYRVDCADTFDSSLWIPCAQPLWATDDQLTFIDSTATTQTRFYRVRVE